MFYRAVPVSMRFPLLLLVAPFRRRNPVQARSHLAPGRKKIEISFSDACGERVETTGNQRIHGGCLGTELDPSRPEAGRKHSRHRTPVATRYSMGANEKRSHLYTHGNRRAHNFFKDNTAPIRNPFDILFPKTEHL